MKISDRDILPNLFIIGAPKCGTTSLFEYLGQHPDIYIPSRKEPDYLTLGNLAAMGRDTHMFQNAVKSYNQYKELYENTTSESYRVDGTVFIYYFDEAIELLKNTCRDYKAVIILRNPVERFISHYRMIFNANHISKLIDEFLDEPYTHNGFNVIELGMYGKRLSRIYDILDKEQVHVMLLDDLTQDPVSTMSKLYEFLGLETIMPLELGAVHNESAGYARNSKLAVMVKKSRCLGFFGKNMKKLLYTNHEEDDDIKSRIFNYYRDDIKILERLTGRNLGMWRLYGH